MDSPGVVSVLYRSPYSVNPDFELVPLFTRIQEKTDYYLNVCKLER